MSWIEKDFMQRIQHKDQLKTKELTHVGKGVFVNDNPKLKLYEETQIYGELAMPLLEKINNQTLML